MSLVWMVCPPRHFGDLRQAKVKALRERDPHRPCLRCRQRHLPLRFTSGTLRSPPVGGTLQCAAQRQEGVLDGPPDLCHGPWTGRKRLTTR